MPSKGLPFQPGDPNGGFADEVLADFQPGNLVKSVSERFYVSSNALRKVILAAWFKAEPVTKQISCFTLFMQSLSKYMIAKPNCAVRLSTTKLKTKWLQRNNLNYNFR